MTIALSFNARTATTLSLNMTGLAAGATAIDFQYATRPDFEFCIAPIVSMPITSPIVLNGLNRRQTYYVRARSVVPQFDFVTSGALPAGATLTRASTATYINNAGARATAAINVARFDYDANTGPIRGLLIEPAATNMMLRSAAMATAPWTAGGGTSTNVGGAASLDGANGFTITDTDAAATATWQQTYNLTVGLPYTVTIEVTKNAVGKATRFVQLRYYLVTGNIFLNLDTATGELALATSSTLSPTAYQAESVGLYWRITCSFVAPAIACGLIISPAFGATAGALAAAGTTASLTGGLVFSAAQLEQTSASTSYIPTAAAAVTRSADVLTLNWASKGVADGAILVRYTFDDLTYQDVATVVAGGNAVVPTNLARTRIRSAYLVGTGAEAWSEVRGYTTAVGVEPAVPTGVLIQPALLMVPQRPNQLVGMNTFAGYPASNLSLPHPMAAWRATPTANVYAFWIETNGSPIDTIAILDTNCSEAATVVIKAGDSLGMVDGSGTAPTYLTSAAQFRASALLPGRRGYHSLLMLPAAIEYRYIRIEITEPNGLPGNTIHVTHALFGRARMTKNYSELTDQGVDFSTTDRLRDGTLDLVTGFRSSKLDFELSQMTETQHETTYADLPQVAGFSTPVFVLPNTKTSPFMHDRMKYGNLTAGRQTNTNMRFTRTFSMESIIN